jgi:elongation factor P
MKVPVNTIRSGSVIDYKGKLWVASKVQLLNPGKGGAFVQIEAKGLLDGNKLMERFRTAETIERVHIEERDCTFLFHEAGIGYTFMDKENYEQIVVPEALMDEDQGKFLQDGMMVTVELYEEKPIGISLPDQVTLTITEADPVVKGQTAASSYKPAVLENGVRVLVPPFISSGERIIVDTSEITYIRRAD